MGFLKSPFFNGLSARYQRLAQGESGSPQDATRADRGVVEKVKDVVVRGSVRAKALIACGLLLIFLILAGGRRYTTPEPRVPVLNSDPQAQYLHLLITAPAPTLPSCRLLVSAGANHYPTPNLVSWESKYNASSLPPTSPSIIKLQTTLDFLATLGPERDEDILLIPDPEGTVFQLRPDVLMERYWEIIRTGTERARVGMGQANRNGTSQKIIFGASKRCALDADDPACYAVPPSTLSSRIYGSKTDKINSKDEIPHLFVREKYLSTSFIMGELKAIKTLYQKALESLHADPTKETEQDVISRIFGEQEYYRAMLRQTDRTKADDSKHLITLFSGLNNLGPLDPHPTHRRPDIKEDAKYEFSITLDYEGLLSSDSLSERIMGFALHNNGDSLRSAPNKAGVSSTRVVALPQDINRSLPPFWSRMPAWDRLPSNLGWKDVPLLTNLFSGSIPASFHHSSTTTKPEELPELAKKNWENLWFHQHTKEQLDEFAKGPDRQFVTLRGGGRETAWWSIWREKWMLRRSKNWAEGEERKEWVEWGEVCDAFWGEVLAEGDGREEGWKPPVHDW